MLQRAMLIPVLPDPRLKSTVLLQTPASCHTICIPDPCRTGRKAAKTLGFLGGQWSPISHPKKS